MNTIPIRPLLALKLATLAALALLMLFLNSCNWAGVHGNGNVTTENRPVANFSTVEADGAFTITWSPGATALSITTDENLHEYIRTRVSGDRLHLDWAKPLQGTHGIKVNISSAALKRVELNGAVRFSGTNLSGTDFYLEGNGATKTILSGRVNAISAELNGASRLDADSLVAHAVEVEISGAGRAEVNATDALKVTVSGAGKVIYSGNPTIQKEINGAGSVQRKE